MTNDNSHQCMATLVAPMENDVDIPTRDRILRTYLGARSWDAEGEYALVRRLVLLPPEGLAPFPYLYDYEWEIEPGRTDKGKGDLIFTDGCGRFAVVEVKWLDFGSTGKTARTSRNEKRSHVRRQARLYAKALADRHPRVRQVLAMIYTNDSKNGGLVVLESSEVQEEVDGAQARPQR